MNTFRFDKQRHITAAGWRQIIGSHAPCQRVHAANRRIFIPPYPFFGFRRLRFPGFWLHRHFLCQCIACHQPFHIHFQQLRIFSADGFLHHLPSHIQKGLSLQNFFIFQRLKHGPEHNHIHPAFGLHGDGVKKINRSRQPRIAFRQRRSPFRRIDNDLSRQLFYIRPWVILQNALLKNAENIRRLHRTVNENLLIAAAPSYKSADR